MLKPVRQTV